MGILYLYLLCICMGFLMPPCASVWMDACRYVSIIFLRTLLYGLVQDNQEAKFGYQNAFLNKWEHPIQVVLIRLATPSPPQKKKGRKKGTEKRKIFIASELPKSDGNCSFLFLLFLRCQSKLDDKVVRLAFKNDPTVFVCPSSSLPFCVSGFCCLCVSDFLNFRLSVCHSGFYFC